MVESDLVGSYSFDCDSSATTNTALAYKEDDNATTSYIAGTTVENSTGTVTIVEIDTANKLISGTFEAYTQTGAGDSKTISDGVFTNIPYVTELPNDNENEFFAKVDGDKFVENAVQATKTSLAGNTNISITATKNSLQSIGLSIPFDSATPGTYNFSAIPTQGSFSAQYNLSNTELYSAASGSITITAHNASARTIEGTFLFTAQHLNASTPSFEITEGSFSVTYAE